MPEFVPEYRYAYNAFNASFVINSDHFGQIYAYVDNHMFRYRFGYLADSNRTEVMESFTKAAKQFGFNLAFNPGHCGGVSLVNPWEVQEENDYRQCLNRLWAFYESLTWEQCKGVSPVINEIVGMTLPAPSESNPGLWAYYSTCQKRALKGSDGKGIRTLIKYGKLLKLLFPDATDEQISAEVESWKECSEAEKAPLTFHFDTTKEAFALVYSGKQVDTLNPCLDWPYKSLQGSCMRHDSEYFGLSNGFHPAMAYASGDFAIAYMSQGSRIAARAVVPLNKGSDKDSKPFRGLSGPIYTASNAASKALKEAIEAGGASFGDSYDVAKDWIKKGLRLKAIPFAYGDKILMPYVDCINSGTYDESDMVVYLDDDGDTNCRTTEGYVYPESENKVTCCDCDERVDEDDSFYSEITGNCYCESCYNERFTCCDKTGETIERDEAVTVYSVGYRGITCEYLVSRDWADSNAVECEDDNEYWEIDDTICINDMYYSPNFTGFETSAWDGENYLTEDCVTLSNGQTVSLDEVKADSAWHCVDGEWKLRPEYQFTDNDCTSWDKMEESLFAIAAE